MKKQVLDFEKISRICGRLAYQILENNINEDEILLVGIKEKGYEIAKIIEQKLKEENYSTLRKLESGLEKKKRKMEVKMKKLKSLELQIQKIEVGEHDRYWRETNYMAHP